MIKFETINELTLKVTTTGNDVIFTKTGAFIAGDCSGNTNYRFEKSFSDRRKSRPGSTRLPDAPRHR